MNTYLPKSASLFLLLAAFSGVLAVPAAGQSFDLLYGPNGGFSSGSSVSADGTRVGGSSSAGATIWTRTTGALQPMALGLPGASGVISGDGLVVGGSRDRARSVYRWREGVPLETLDVPTGSNLVSVASINNDGSILVGNASFPGERPGAPSRYQSIRWGPEGAYTEIGSSATLGSNQARAISRDGSTIVGWAFGNNVAYKWTQAGNIQILPSLPGTLPDTSVASAVSGDGQFIVGWSNARSVVWHGNTVTELRTPSRDGRFADAEAISDDGNVIAGQVFDDVTSTFVAGVWTPATQFIPLTDYLASFGVQVPAGVRLENVLCLSADGTTFVGSGTITDGGSLRDIGFVTTIPGPGGVVALLASALLASRRRRV